MGCYRSHPVLTAIAISGRYGRPVWLAWPSRTYSFWRPTQTPSDTLYEEHQSPYLVPLGAEAAWDLATGSQTVVVAVLDTGVDVNHPEFAGRLWTNTREIPGNGLDDDANGCVDDINGCRFLNLTQERATACGYNTNEPNGLVMDDHGKSGSVHHSHGTIVAGILGAGGDNGLGVTGVAWDVRIMVVKVLDCGVPVSRWPGGRRSQQRCPGDRVCPQDGGEHHQCEPLDSR